MTTRHLLVFCNVLLHYCLMFHLITGTHWHKDLPLACSLLPLFYTLQNLRLVSGIRLHNFVWTSTTLKGIPMQSSNTQETVSGLQSDWKLCPCCSSVEACVWPVSGISTLTPPDSCWTINKYYLKWVGLFGGHNLRPGNTNWNYVPHIKMQVRFVKCHVSVNSSATSTHLHVKQ